MTRRRSSARRAARARRIARPTAKRRRRVLASAPAAFATAPLPPAAPKRRRNPNRHFWRVGEQKPWKNPNRHYWRVGERKPWKNPRRARRNPGAAAADHGGGLMGDVRGLGSALADIARSPMGLAWAAGGAAVTAVGGNLVAAQVARMMPTMTPGTGRLVNAAVFAGVAVGASRLIRDRTRRRQVMAGGLAMAAVELLSPGKTFEITAKVPGLRSLLPMPAISAMPPHAELIARRAALPAPRALAGTDPEPIAIDGLAEAEPGGGDSSNAMGELVPTYLNGLGCPLTGRSNELTKLVTP